MQLQVCALKVQWLDAKETLAQRPFPFRSFLNTTLSNLTKLHLAINYSTPSPVSRVSVELQMSLSFLLDELRLWTPTQILVSGALLGLFTGVAFCIIASYYTPSDIENPEIWESWNLTLLDLKLTALH